MARGRFTKSWRGNAIGYGGRYKNMDYAWQRTLRRLPEASQIRYEMAAAGYGQRITAEEHQALRREIRAQTDAEQLRRSKAGSE